jgi:uncharacterized membrane protein YeaQ/YmgE (transglycosylase-associated protein family)
MLVCDLAALETERLAFSQSPRGASASCFRHASPRQRGLAQPHARAFPIFVDGEHAGRFEGGTDGGRRKSDAAGWIAAKFLTKYGMGVVGDVIVGVIGAYIGNWLAPRLGVHFGTGLARTSLNATVGAIVLLLLVRLIRRV